jgi:hypothetical protein
VKRRGATLYEVSRSRLSQQRARSGQSPSQPTPQPRPSTDSGAKVPVGLLALGAVGVCVVALLIWWIGAAQSALPQDNSTVAGPGPIQPPGHVIDPLVQPAPTPAQVTPPLPILEPRQAGQWYFVLAETRPEGARRLAAYCRAQGLDAAVISGHNTRLERVIALPGLDSASTTTDAYRALDERIRDVGRRWKASGGTTNLSDRYLDRKKNKP